MASIFRNGDTVIRLDKISAVCIEDSEDKVVKVILNNLYAFWFQCQTPEEAKELVNIIQKELETSE